MIRIALCIVVAGQVTRDPTREVEDTLFHKCECGRFGLHFGLRLQRFEVKTEGKQEVIFREWCPGEDSNLHARKGTST